MSSAMAWFPALAAACVAGLAWSAVARAAARRWSIVDRPNPIVPQHTRPTAYLGGLGIALGVATVAALYPTARTWASLHTWSVVVPAALFLAIGTADDLRRFSPGRKFLLQGLAAMLAVGAGLSYAFTGNALIDAAISWFWVVTVVNAFNLTDVCDGLVGGLSVVAFVSVAVLAPSLAPVVLVAAGACIGFLVFNLPQASMFLGDGGSHLLGFLVAAFLVDSRAGSGPLHALPMILIAGVPLFELVQLVVVRTRKGLKWWRGSPDHFSLRLQAAGLSKLQTDSIAWGVAIVLGAAAVVLAAVEGP